MSKPSTKAMDAAKKRAHAALVRWKPLLGLGTWKVTMRYYRAVKDVPKVHRGKDAAGYGAAMWCDVHWPYMMATIGVVLPRIATADDEEITMMVRHELLHAVVGEMRAWESHPAERAIDHEERVVSLLTAAFNWTHAAGWNEGRADLRRRQKAKAG